jgi:hypothetical protein
MDDQIRHRFTVLTWAAGITAGLVIATLGMVVSLSYQLGQGVLISHLQMK